MIIFQNSEGTLYRDEDQVLCMWSILCFKAKYISWNCYLALQKSEVRLILFLLFWNMPFLSSRFLNWSFWTEVFGLFGDGGCKQGSTALRETSYFFPSLPRSLKAACCSAFSSNAHLIERSWLKAQWSCRTGGAEIPIQKHCGFSM